MTAPELKPCPFCGGEAITSPSVVDRQVLYAHCKDHTCPGWTVSRCPPVRWNRRADLTAVQPDPNAGAATVKPLVWGDYPNRAFANPDVYVAEAPFSHKYQAQRDPWANSFMAYLHPTAPIASSTLWWESKGHATIEDAQAAAQADYEARIMAAIDVQPDPRDEVIARLVEAMHTISGDIQINADGEEELSDAARIARAALAAAKAAQS